MYNMIINQTMITLENAWSDCFVRYVLLCPSAYIVTIKALQFANVSKPFSEPISHESFLSDKGFQNIFHMLFFLVTEIHASINLCFKWKRWDIWDFILATKIDQFYYNVLDSYSKIDQMLRDSVLLWDLDTKLQKWRRCHRHQILSRFLLQWSI